MMGLGLKVSDRARNTTQMFRPRARVVKKVIYTMAYVKFRRSIYLKISAHLLRGQLIHVLSEMRENSYPISYIVYLFVL